MTYYIYHNPRCAKSRLALKYMRRYDIDFEDVRYIKESFSHDFALKLIKNFNKDDILRKGEIAYKELIDRKSLSDDALAEIMVNNPSLLQRPLIVCPDGHMFIARPPEKVIEYLDKHA